MKIEIRQTCSQTGPSIGDCVGTVFLLALAQPRLYFSAGLATNDYDKISSTSNHSELTVATIDVLSTGGVKPGGCVIEMVVVPTASGSKAVSR